MWCSDSFSHYSSKVYVNYLSNYKNKKDHIRNKLSGVPPDVQGVQGGQDEKGPGDVHHVCCVVIHFLIIIVKFM